MTDRVLAIDPEIRGEIRDIVEQSLRCSAPGLSDAIRAGIARNIAFKVSHAVGWRPHDQLMAVARRKTESIRTAFGPRHSPDVGEISFLLRMAECYVASYPAPLAWRPPDTAPPNTEVEVRVGAMTFLAKLVPDGGMNMDSTSCDQWQATREGEHPPCWSDGCCWASNEDENPSMSVEAWRPASAVGDVRGDHEPGLIRMLSADNARMRHAGTALSEAALYVVREYDGCHRLSLAVADWAKAIADEGGRGARYASPAVPASPIKGGGTPTWPASYQETFDAIAAAVTVHDGTTFGISVKAFYRALAHPETASPPAPAEHWTKIDGKLYANVSTRPFACPECDGRSYACVDERKADGTYRPGLLIRCVECKTVYRDANAVEFPIAAPAEHGVEPQVIRDIARMVREKAEEIRLVIDRHTSPRGAGIYMASKTAHAPEWRRLRAEGLPIISTWIDEAGKGETACFTDLWQRCVDEAATASVVIVYRQPGEVLKGAFVEAGAALACGVPVLAVGCDEFSFSNHAGVERLGTLHAALDRARQILVEMPALSQGGGAGRSEKGAGDGLERVRHVKRGTEYEVLGEAEAQVSTGPWLGGPRGHNRLVGDGTMLTVYRCLKTGKLWCRFTDEFRDGRFVPAAPAQSPSTSDGEG